MACDLVKMAVTPPMEPVFLSLPIDVLNMEYEEEVFATFRIDFQASPSDHGRKKWLLQPLWKCCAGLQTSI